LAFRRVRPEEVSGHVTTGATSTGCGGSSGLRADTGCACASGTSASTSRAAGAVFQVARQGAADMLSQASSNLEEIERDTYKGREVWNITLSLPRDVSQLTSFAQLAADPLQYKRFLIDAETGELLAVKLREVASQ
jgi:hypothetical protein